MNQLDWIDREITRRFRKKKISGLIVCCLVFVLGMSSFVYKARYEGGDLTCFREMTVTGTVFTSLTSFVLVWLYRRELKNKNPHTSGFLDFWRLSTAVTELMILFIVLLGYTPLSQDRPKLLRYDMMNMHLNIPILTVVTFVLNDEAIGKCNWKRLTGGLIFLALYGVLSIILILLRVIPEEKIPYKFLNVWSGQAWYIIGGGAGCLRGRISFFRFPILAEPQAFLVVLVQKSERFPKKAENLTVSPRRFFFSITSALLRQNEFRTICRRVDPWRFSSILSPH